MKLFVIGGTGRTGREVVQQALVRNHQVTAFVRSPERLTLKDERLSIVKGSATNENQLGNAMQNHDAVISTLGPRKPFQQTSLLHDSADWFTKALGKILRMRTIIDKKRSGFE